MKKILHKILSVLMASEVFFSKLSFTIDMHYCGNSLVDFSLLVNVPFNAKYALSSAPGVSEVASIVATEVN